MLRMEELIRELSQDYTIVTYNMRQAGRVSDFTAFFSMHKDRAGSLVSYGKTPDIFTNPEKTDRGLCIKPLRLGRMAAPALHVQIMPADAFLTNERFSVLY
jgi:hypothetical protein